MTTSRPIARAALLLVITLSLARAQDRPAPASLADLDDATLLARASSAASRLADAEKALDAEQKALASGSDQLKENEARTESLSIPDAKAPETAGATPLVSAKANQDAASSRLLALRTREKLLEDASALQDDRSHRLESARAALRSVSGALDEAEPLATEVEARVASKKIAAAKLPGIAASRIRTRRSFLAARDATWQREATQTRESTGPLAPRIARARDDVKAAEKALARASRVLVELQGRDAIEKELGDRDPSALAALLSTLAIDRDRLAGALDPARLAFEKARDALASAESDVAREPAPDAEKVPVDRAPARVMNAQRTLNLVQLVADYQQRRVDRLVSLEQALATLSDRAQAAVSSAGALDAVLLRMSVIASLLKQKRGDAGNTSVEDERGRIAVISDTATDAAANASHRASSVEKEIAEALALTKAQHDKLPGLKSAYEQAKANARWTQEVEQLPLPEVVRRFVEARDQSKSADAAVASARRRLSDATAAVASANLELQSLDDPPSRRAREENPDVRRRIISALAKLTGQDPPLESLAKVPDPLANPASAPSATPAKGSEALAQEIEAREATLASRARSLEEQAQELTACVALAVEAENAAAALVRTLADQQSSTQRAYGCALELETRVGLSQVASERLPPGVSEAASHDRLASIESEASAAEASLASMKAQRDRFESRRLDATKAREAVAQAVAIRGKMVETLRERASREGSFDRTNASLADSEKRRREQEVLRRIESEDSPRETVLGIFTNDRASVLAELLRSCYGDLLDLERKRKDLEERSRLTNDLLSIAEEERRNDAARLPFAQRHLVQSRADDAFAAIRAGIVSAKDPQALASLRADGQSPPAPELPSKDDLVATADRLFAARARVISAESLVRGLEQRLSASGIDLEKGARQDELGELATRIDTVERDRRRISNEISQTRVLRARVLERAATGAIARLLLIPLIAFAIIRLMLGLGARIVKRARTASGTATPEREHRAETIVHVFGRAWAGVVVTVAGIYMLKELKIDVTPILASAGVLGLAIAFGAQTLIRDYLAGFFILVENQYKIGDTVKIGESTGLVERITLRLTVLRALDGTVFYIPNGSVDRVANMTREWANATLRIAVGYDSDIEHVTTVLKQVGKELDDDELFGGKILEPPQVLGIEDFGDNGITLSVLFRVLPNEQLVVLREARIRLKKAFDRESIALAESPDVVHHVYPPEPPKPPVPREPETRTAYGSGSSPG